MGAMASNKNSPNDQIKLNIFSKINICFLVQFLSSSEGFTHFTDIRGGLWIQRLPSWSVHTENETNLTFLFTYMVAVNVHFQCSLLLKIFPQSSHLPNLYLDNLQMLPCQNRS